MFPKSQVSDIIVDKLFDNEITLMKKFSHKKGVQYNARYLRRPSSRKREETSDINLPKARSPILV